MPTDIYTKSILNYTTSLDPSQINNSINNTIEQRIKEEMEGKCINDGYIKKNSIKIVSRSTGKIMVSQFNGAVVYTVRYSADICNPLEGAIIKAEIVNINKMGVLAKGGDDDPAPLSIILARQHHIDNQTFEKLKVKDKIKVKILGKRFEFGDNQINIIGVLDETKDAVKEGAIHYYSNSKEYKWLSSFNLAMPFVFDGRTYATVEHAFHAQKVDMDEYKDMLTQGTANYIGNTASKAKTFGSKKNFEKLNLELREDWNDVRYELMYNILDTYYNANEQMKEKLIETGNSPLIHKGFRIDTYWGVNSHMNGENNHGKILMELREKYMNE